MVSRETVSEKELYEYISEQDTLKEMLMGMGSGDIEITTNSIDVLSLVIGGIHEKTGGMLGVVHTNAKMFDKHWKLNQYTDRMKTYAFTESFNNKSKVKGFRSIEEDTFEIANRALVQKKKGIYLATTKVLDKTIIKKTESKNDIIVKIGVKIDRDELFNKLEKWGYAQLDWCTSKNTYASRGGIIDIFPTLHKHPIRVELVGSSVVSMRVFNITTQESIKEIEEIKINQPLSKNKNSTEDKLRNIYSSTVKNVLYITSEYNENTVKTEGRFDLFCEQLSQKTLPVRLMNKKINDYVNRGERVFVFRGVKVERSLEKQINRCDMVFGENVKCLALGTIFFGTPGTTQKYKKNIAQNTQQRPVSSLSDIKWGDVLVHQDYGLGVYRGLEQLTGGNENIKIEYLGGANVFVPLDKFERVHKYIGPGGGTPKLTKLGSGAWEKQKLTTRKSVDRVVSHLIENYKQKQKPRGFVYTGDSELIQQVVDSFPYNETPDQSQSISDVYSDMSKDKPMDRLVYGDVGFGKTEVAIRAAIMAITSGKGVFFLAPTTVLSDQHYITCVNRLGPVGVRVELLSRFKSKKEQVEILENYKNGQVDMLVGTHRLLSGDIDIGRLGLLIVDEEHRFGVKHKEAIRGIKKGVDVLTLTATPIPRTLQQSLVGIRDTSKIETPPQDRLPIKTYINRFDWVEIKNKIQFEINRGGQVYFVHNEVESIPFIVERLAGDFPNAKISGAHGQMASGPLEKTVLGFFKKEVDVLVCTTIIESGLDVKNANTIIVNNAQNFGLSQLYQIRGRVGRAGRQAFCYLCIPRKIKLLPDAYQRLKTMEHYTSLGSGYHVATKDLEIRGAGNVFGYEQSGQMLQVGLELYNKILSEAISKETGVNKKTANSVVVSIDRDSLISTNYMPSTTDRLRFYQELVGVKNGDGLKDIRKRIEDQFGAIDQSIENLFIVTEIRLALLNTPVDKCAIKGASVGFNIKTDVTINTVVFMKRLVGFSKKINKNYRFESVGKKNWVYFDNIKDLGLIETARGFAGLFSGVVVD